MSFYSVMRKLAFPLVKLLYPTKIINREYMPQGKALVLSNHYSVMDVAIVAVAFFKDEFHALAKEELFRKKGTAKLLLKLGGIPVDRDGNDTVAIKKAVGVLVSNKQLFLCPEGTRNKSGGEQMLPLKEGAAVFAVKTRAPVVLMLLYRKPRLFRKNYLIVGKPFELEEFYGDRSANMKVSATAVLAEKFAQLRKELNEYIENKVR